MSRSKLKDHPSGNRITRPISTPAPSARPTLAASHRTSKHSRILVQRGQAWGQIIKHLNGRNAQDYVYAFWHKLQALGRHNSHLLFARSTSRRGDCTSVSSCQSLDTVVGEFVLNGSPVPKGLAAHIYAPRTGLMLRNSPADVMLNRMVKNRLLEFDALRQ